MCKLSLSGKHLVSFKSELQGRLLGPPACFFLRWRLGVRETVVICQPNALRVTIRVFSGKIMPPRGRETTA